MGKACTIWLQAVPSPVTQLSSNPAGSQDFLTQGSKLGMFESPAQIPLPIIAYLIKKYIHAKGLDMSRVPHLASAEHPGAACSVKQVIGE